MFRKPLVMGALCGVALAWTMPMPASAQRMMNPTGPMQTTSHVFLEGSGGVAVPSARLSEYTNPGPAVDLTVGYRLTDRWAFRVNGDFEGLEGVNTFGSVAAPNMRLFHLTGGIQANVLPNAARQWRLTVDAGAGVASFDTDHFVWLMDPGLSREFNYTYFAAEGGLRLAYAPTERVSVEVGARAVDTFVDQNDTNMLANIDPTRLQTFGQTVTVPITAGIEVKL